MIEMVVVLVVSCAVHSLEKIKLSHRFVCLGASKIGKFSVSKPEVGKSGRTRGSKEGQN